MKILVLMTAALAMIRFAVAWDTTEQMQYTYPKTVDMQTDLNQSTSVSYEQINASDAYPTISGSWADFSSAYTTNGASTTDIETNAISSANFDMYK